LEQYRKPAIAEVKYNSKALLYKLTIPSATTMEKYGPPAYPIEVHIYLYDSKEG
jgi:hypothetical protein